MKPFILGLIFSFLVGGRLIAVTSLSAGHVDIFEIHYDATLNPVDFALHVHDHGTEAHFEPADVILQVTEVALFAPPPGLVSVLGAEAYILPSSQEDGMLYGGVSAAGPLGVFQNNRFTIRMVSAGADNPGNFVMYRFSGGGAVQVGLQSVKDSVSVSQFTVPINTHEHWNWGFSAPGMYTFEFKGLATRTADLTVLETSPEIFTFQVIPEPSSKILLLTAWIVWTGLRRFRF